MKKLNTSSKLPQLAAQFVTKVLHHSPKDSLVINAAFLAGLYEWDEERDPNESKLLFHIWPVFQRTSVLTKDSATRAAAILHDLVEDEADKIGDREKTYKLIASVCNTEVAETVASVTNPIPQIPTDLVTQGDKDVFERKVYHEHVLFISLPHKKGRLVKLADFCENGGSISKVKDKNRQLRLVKRYGPLYTPFINLARGLKYEEGVKTLETAYETVEKVLSQRTGK